MIDTIYYYWSTTCPWCAKVEHFIKVLEMHGYKVVRATIDVDVSNELIDLNVLFKQFVGMDENPIAPLIVIKYYKNGKEQYLFVPIPSDEEEASKDEETIKKDVAKLVMLTLKAMYILGVNVEKILEEDAVVKLLEPLLQDT